jgi:glycosyltransferase involved in cell wall biosynthesis
MSARNLKVAIVHDWLNQVGGAEEVLEVLHQLFPQAPIYTSIYAPKAMPPAYRSWDIRTSLVQHLPLATSKHQAYLFFYPWAFERFELNDYDLVLANSSGFCHGVRTRPPTMHITYCLTPPRYVWNYPDYIRHEGVGTLPRLFLPLFIGRLRHWDVRASQRTDHFIAISQTVRERIFSYYGRQAAIIYPPVDTSSYQVTDRIDDYFLIVSRLVPYKRIHLAVEAFNALKLPLVVIGEGRARAALQRLAQPNVRFLGRLPQEEVRRYMARCQAFIFPGEEDFGIAPVEAQAAGRPVIAYAGGGALDSVVQDVTGTFFREPAAESLAQAVRQFDHRAYDPAAIRDHALGFDTQVFKDKIIDFIRGKGVPL